MKYRRYIRDWEYDWIYSKEEIVTVFDDGARVIAKDRDGSVMFDGSKWLFEKCFERDYHRELP